MYDKRESFHIAQEAISFVFRTSRYEIWSGGKLIDEGRVNGHIQCMPSLFSKAQSEIKFFDLPEKLNVRHTLLFDITFTSNDRIYLATVPRQSNINHYDSFMNFKTNVPIGFPIETREKRDFDINEPYVCSVFTIDSTVKKVSFSFGNSPRLLEFYID